MRLDQFVSVLGSKDFWLGQVTVDLCGESLR